MTPRSAQAPIPPRRRVLLVDDHPLLCEGVAGWINREPDLEVCGQADTTAKALGLVNKLRPALVVTDYTLPGRDGLDLVKDLRVMDPKLPVLVLSMHDESLFAERALRAGARGYVMKAEGGETLLVAIRQVLAGEVYVSRKVAASLFDAIGDPRPRGSQSPIGTLSDREFGVFRLLGQGKTSKEIGALLKIGSKTVDVHRANIKTKLKLPSGPALIHHAVNWAAAEKQTP